MPQGPLDTQRIIADMVAEGYSDDEIREVVQGVQAKMPAPGVAAAGPTFESLSGLSRLPMTALTVPQREAISRGADWAMTPIPWLQSVAETVAAPVGAAVEGLASLMPGGRTAPNLGPADTTPRVHAPQMGQGLAITNALRQFAEQGPAGMLGDTAEAVTNTLIPQTRGEVASELALGPLGVLLARGAMRGGRAVGSAVSKAAKAFEGVPGGRLVTNPKTQLDELLAMLQDVTPPPVGPEQARLSAITPQGQPPVTLSPAARQAAGRVSEVEEAAAREVAHGLDPASQVSPWPRPTPPGPITDPSRLLPAPAAPVRRSRLEATAQGDQATAIQEAADRLAGRAAPPKPPVGVPGGRLVKEPVRQPTPLEQMLASLRETDAAADELAPGVLTPSGQPPVTLSPQARRAAGQVSEADEALARSVARGETPPAPELPPAPQAPPTPRGPLAGPSTPGVVTAAPTPAPGETLVADARASIAAMVEDGFSEAAATQAILRGLRGEQRQIVESALRGAPAGPTGAASTPGGNAAAAIRYVQRPGTISAELPDGTVVGSVNYIDNGPEGVSLANIDVNPEMQRQGIGTRLLDELRGVAGTRPLDRGDAVTPEGRAFRAATQPAIDTLRETAEQSAAARAAAPFGGGPLRQALPATDARGRAVVQPGTTGTTTALDPEGNFSWGIEGTSSPSKTIRTGTTPEAVPGILAGDVPAGPRPAPIGEPEVDALIAQLDQVDPAVGQAAALVPEAAPALARVLKSGQTVSFTGGPEARDLAQGAQKLATRVAKMFEGGQLDTTSLLDLQRLVGAEDASRLSGVPQDVVRTATGQAGRQPLVRRMRDLDRQYRRLIADPEGFISAELASTGGGAILGGAISATEGEDLKSIMAHALSGALMGGMLGFGAAKGAKAVGNLFRGPAGKHVMTRVVEPYDTANLLAGPAVVKANLGSLGGIATAMGELFLTKQTARLQRGLRHMKSQWVTDWTSTLTAPETRLRQIQEEVFPDLRMRRAGQEPSAFQHIASFVGRPFVAGDYAGRRALEAMGFSKDEASRFLVTGTPTSAPGNAFLDAINTWTLTRMLFKFPRVRTQLLERGLEFSPLGVNKTIAEGVRGAKGAQPLTEAQRRARAIMGTAAFGAGGVFGALADPSLATVGLVSSAGGPAALPLTMGMLGGQALAQGGSLFDAANTIGQEAVRTTPMYTEARAVSPTNLAQRMTPGRALMRGVTITLPEAVEDVLKLFGGGGR